MAACWISYSSIDCCFDLRNLISNKNIFAFWIFYFTLMVRWLSVSLFGFFSGGVIIAFILKHKFNWKFQFWWLNDTPDGDYGEGKGFFNIISWWFRNHSWNYIRQFKPGWMAGEADEFKTIKNTVKGNRWRRASKENHGTKYIAYRINNKVYCQFSYANKFISIQLGGGSEYRFRVKF